MNSADADLIYIEPVGSMLCDASGMQVYQVYLSDDKRGVFTVAKALRNHEPFLKRWLDIGQLLGYKGTFIFSEIEGAGGGLSDYRPIVEGMDRVKPGDDIYRFRIRGRFHIETKSVKECEYLLHGVNRHTHCTASFHSALGGGP